MGNSSSGNDCMSSVFGRSRTRGFVEIPKYDDGRTYNNTASLQGPANPPPFSTELKTTISNLCDKIKVRNREIEICERQVLRFGRSPGKDARRWALHYYRKHKRLSTHVTRYHNMVEMMQVLYDEMRMASDTADAYKNIAKYSNEFKTIVAQLEECNIGQILEDVSDAMHAMKDVDETFESTLDPTNTLSSDELDEYTRELEELEEKHGKKSLDAYLYTGDVFESDNAPNTPASSKKDTDSHTSVPFLEDVRRFVTS